MEAATRHDRAVLAAMFLVLSASPGSAGAIRVGKDLGPLARRVVAGLRQEREARDRARDERELRRRIAIAKVTLDEGDPEVAERIAAVFEARLRAVGFRVAPFQAVQARIDAAGRELLRSRVGLRQLARRLGVGALVSLEVPVHRLVAARQSGYALPTWWDRTQLDGELAEVRIRLQVFDAVGGERVLDRQDRQMRPVPRPPQGVPPPRTEVMADAVEVTADHLLEGFTPEGFPGPDPGSGSGSGQVVGHAVEVQGDEQEFHEHGELDGHRVQDRPPSAPPRSGLSGRGADTRNIGRTPDDL